VEEASEQELSDAVARADRTGLFTCPHTGVAFAALFKLLERGEIKRDDRVVVISTAHGLKFTEFKVNYHRSELSQFGVEPQLPNMPVELAADYGAVQNALFGALEKRKG
jgi:threonine synthase